MDKDNEPRNSANSHKTWELTLMEYSDRNSLFLSSLEGTARMEWIQFPLMPCAARILANLLPLSKTRQKITTNKSISIGMVTTHSVHNTLLRVITIYLLIAAFLWKNQIFVVLYCQSLIKLFMFILLYSGNLNMTRNCPLIYQYLLNLFFKNLLGMPFYRDGNGMGLVEGHSPCSRTRSHPRPPHFLLLGIIFSRYCPQRGFSPDEAPMGIFTRYFLFSL